MSCNISKIGIREEPGQHKTEEALDLRKVRRRIEDRLRKDDEAVMAAAVLLKIKTN
jgi:hypothetical protein